MERAVAISELDPAAVDAFDRWITELRLRRDDFDRSFRAAGVASFASWIEPDNAVVITKVEGADLRAARRRLAEVATPFDHWYRECEVRLFGSSPLAPGAPVAETLFDMQVDEPDALDLFMVAALPLRPDKVAAYRAAATHVGDSERGRSRMHRWQLKRYTIWLQRTPRATWAIFDGVGDLGHMLRDLSTSPDPEMVFEREFIREMYGVDMTETSFSLPRAAWSWTA